MPLYEYRCDSCELETEELRTIANRDTRLACPRCTEPMRRVVSATPGVVKNPAVEKKQRYK